MSPDRLPIPEKPLEKLLVLYEVPLDHYASSIEIRAKLIMQDSDNSFYTLDEVKATLQELVDLTKITQREQDGQKLDAFKKNDSTSTRTPLPTKPVLAPV
jgi:hypothetical protein